MRVGGRGNVEAAAVMGVEDEAGKQSASQKAPCSEFAHAVRRLVRQKNNNVHAIGVLFPLIPQSNYTLPSLSSSTLVLLLLLLLLSALLCLSVQLDATQRGEARCGAVRRAVMDGGECVSTLWIVLCAQCAHGNE